MLKTIFAILLVVGGLNWGLVGLFSFDLVAWICGGAATWVARAIYILVGVSAVGYALGWMMNAGSEQGSASHA